MNQATIEPIDMTIRMKSPKKQPCDLWRQSGSRRKDAATPTANIVMQVNKFLTSFFPHTSHTKPFRFKATLAVPKRPTSTDVVDRVSRRMTSSMTSRQRRSAKINLHRAMAAPGNRWERLDQRFITETFDSSKGAITCKIKHAIKLAIKFKN